MRGAGIRRCVTAWFGENAYFHGRWLVKHGFRYRKLWCYWPIDGWLPEEEALALYNTALAIPDEGPVCVEIGSWQGKSSVVLGRAVQRKKRGAVYCVDPFDASGDDRSIAAFKPRVEKLQAGLKEIFSANVSRCGLNDVIRIKQGKSQDVVGSWSQAIDLLFIDGDHSYEAVVRDFLSWSGFIKPGGFLLLHDVHADHQGNPEHAEGPYRLVQDYIRDNPQWDCQRQVCSLFIARKTP